MRSTASALPRSRIKLQIEIDEAELIEQLESTLERLAREVSIPGFRPGRAPKRVVQARIGGPELRRQALEDALPEFYSRALGDSGHEAVASPEIEITAGRESGPVTVEAVVDVMPEVDLPGYKGLAVEVPALTVTEKELNFYLDRLRDQAAELVPVDRPAREGDHLTLDIEVTVDGQRIDELCLQDSVYELGSGDFLPELDTELIGVESGQAKEFEAADLRVDGESDRSRLQVHATVKEVREKLRPDLTDEWAQDASEFATLEELKASIEERILVLKRAQVLPVVRDRAVEELAKLVSAELPESLVANEFNSRLHSLAHDLSTHKRTLAEYLNDRNQTQEEFVGFVKERSEQAVRARLALDYLVKAEKIEVDAGDLEAEIGALAARSAVTVGEALRALEHDGRLDQIRLQVLHTKAINWLLEHVELVDPEGGPVSREALFGASPEGDETGSDGSVDSGTGA
jgi:trigger factor